mmetsp:Transcript_4142/g.10051  ORF Transcript_4142/g.10051 Transcript_4142/m.10051 type:complete len:414 (-) Transcript_4142:417-1658(-)
MVGQGDACLPVQSLVPNCHLHSYMQRASSCARLARGWGVLLSLFAVAGTATGATTSETPLVCLGEAGKFAILSKAALSGTAAHITGDVGSQAAITFAPMFPGDATSMFWTSTQITGRMYAASYAAPTPAMLAVAITDMDAAYADAAQRPVLLSRTNIMPGGVSFNNFTAGVYKWDSYLTFAGSHFNIVGGQNDIFIFQIASYVTIAASMKAQLVSDGTGRGVPQASNIFWQVGGYLVLGASAHLEGTFLVTGYVTFGASSTLNGRVLSVGAATISANVIVAPSPPPPGSPPCVQQCTSSRSQRIPDSPPPPPGPPPSPPPPSPPPNPPPPPPKGSPPPLPPLLPKGSPPPPSRSTSGSGSLRNAGSGVSSKYACCCCCLPDCCCSPWSPSLRYCRKDSALTRTFWPRSCCSSL